MKIILKKITNVISEDNERKSLEFASCKEEDESLKVKIKVSGSKEAITEFMNRVNILEVEEELEIDFGKNKQTRLSENY